jgi:hypothetical protein
MPNIKIQTLHPDPGKQGTNIDRDKYDQIKSAMLTVIKARGEMEFRELSKAVELALKTPFDGSIPWYVITVKLDLEARGMIERIPGARPQRLRLISPS